MGAWLVKTIFSLYFSTGVDVITERVDLPAGLSNDLRNGTKIFRGLGLILEWILELALGSMELVHAG